MANESDRSDKATVGRVFAKSALGTVNLVVAGAAAVGAAALHSVPVLALGGVAYAALVAWDLVTPAFWRKARAPEAEKLPDPSDLTDQSLRELVRSLEAGRERLDQVLAETPDEVKGHLGGVMASMVEMETGAARLVKRAEELGRYLATTDRAPVEQEIRSLADKARAARDAETRAEYEGARATRQEQLRALDDIAAARERVIANLVRTVATLEGLPPKVVRMRALDAQAMDALSGSISDELEHINGDMKVFEETLRSLGETVHA